MDWLEDNPTDAGIGLDWLFNYSHLFDSFNLFPDISAGYQDQVTVNLDDEEVAASRLQTTTKILTPATSQNLDDGSISSTLPVNNPQAQDV